MDKRNFIIVSLILLSVWIGMFCYRLGYNSKVERVENKLQWRTQQLELAVQYKDLYDQCVTDQLPNLNE